MASSTLRAKTAFENQFGPALRVAQALGANGYSLHPGGPYDLLN
jgi:hypothetical protein